MQKVCTTAHTWQPEDTCRNQFSHSTTWTLGIKLRACQAWWQAPSLA